MSLSLFPRIASITALVLWLRTRVHVRVLGLEVGFLPLILGWETALVEFSDSRSDSSRLVEIKLR